MSKVAIPVINSGNAEVDRFAQATKQALDGISGQLQNSADLVALTKDATPLQLVNLLNSVIRRLGEDGAGTFDVLSQFPVMADVTAAAPPGAIIFFPFAAAPTGWVKANGALLSRATYAALFAAANADGLVSEATWSATSWGRFSVGDGSTTFRLPDLRGEFVRATDDGRGVDAGRAYGTSQLDQLQGHKHQVNTNVGVTAGSPYNAFVVGNNTSSLEPLETRGSISTAISDGVNGTPRYGTETRARNLAFLACVKY